MIWHAVPAGRLLAGPVWRHPSAVFLLPLPGLVSFGPEGRKARGARLPMSGSWGGSLRGRARFLPQEKGALPLKPARQIINETKTGRLLKRRPRFVSWELSLTPGSEAPVRRAQLQMRPLLPRPVPCCSALNGGRCVGRALPRAFGKGSLRRGPFVTAGKRGLFSSTYSCLRPALPWWPGRSAVPRWWG